MTEGSASESKPAKAAWNPRAIEYIGFFCSFLPAGIMWAINYARLGYPEKKIPRLLLTIVGFIGFVVLEGFIPHERFRKFIGLLVNFAVSYFFYRDQQALFDEYTAKGGTRASNRIPLVLSILFVGLLLMVSSCANHLEGLMEKNEHAMRLINATDDNVKKIETALRLLTKEGSWGSFVIFFSDKAKNYYVQCAGERGKTKMHCEAVSNESLKPAFKLGETQIQQLLSLGWNPPKDVSDPNFYRDWEILDDESRTRIAREVMDTLAVYGLSPNQKLEVELTLE